MYSFSSILATQYDTRDLQAWIANNLELMALEELGVVIMTEAELAIIKNQLDQLFVELTRRLEVAGHTNKTIPKLG